MYKVPWKHRQGQFLEPWDIKSGFEVFVEVHRVDRRVQMEGFWTI